jgi:hypothetical protein
MGPVTATRGSGLEAALGENCWDHSSTRKKAQRTPYTRKKSGVNPTGPIRLLCGRILDSGKTHQDYRQGLSIVAPSPPEADEE